MPNLNTQVIRALPFAYPSLDEQRRIAAILDQADGLRRKRRLALVQLQALQRSTLDTTLENEKSAAVALGDLVAEFRYGTSERADGRGLPVLRIPNVVGDSISIEELKHVELPTDEVDRLRLREGDLLFVRTNGNRDYVARSAVVARGLGNQIGLSPDAFVYASYLIRARLRDDAADPVFIQAYLSSQRGRKAALERAKTSAGQFNINIEGLSSIPVVLPSIDLQRAFAARVAEIDKLKAHHRAHLAKLDALFASLQHRAFRGEL